MDEDRYWFHMSGIFDYSARKSVMILNQEHSHRKHWGIVL